jgi:hypothetical protein
MRIGMGWGVREDFPALLREQIANDRFANQRLACALALGISKMKTP